MSAAFLLAAAAAIPNDDLVWTPQEVRAKLEALADQLEPAGIVDQQMVARIPLTGPHLAEAIGRLPFRVETVGTDYERCVQIAQMLGDCANRLDVKGDPTRAELLREYGRSVSRAGGAL